MNASPARAIAAVICAITLLSLASPSWAQQAAPATEAPTQAAPTAQMPSAAAPSTSAPAVSDAGATAVDGARPLKSTMSVPRELSPWSMFMSADILVKAVMIGLAFASLVTWTIFLAKMIELSVNQRKLRAALAEIVRAEARRIRLGMGLLATIGATSPFVGLFGTVWGIMNSFIGISKSQTTNLAVVAPGIAEALLATAFGLAAAIPAVIIYNHFTRVTKGYLELVGRSSGAAARLLSRDLDRTHGSSHSRAAE